jgi:glycosyltransferase involved in cell wall biosynthesis
MTRKQGKVSMVMPCYNKETYISTMFDTILNQTWDTIELVLVNDGSTDGTRDIISIYEPTFKTRGYEIVIIDQPNAGVCAAAKTGLTHATGDYVCLVDSDDELDSEYVATMATWLDEHADCDIAICSGINFRETNEGREFWHHPSKRLPADDNEIGPEHFLMGEIIRQTVWVYMARAEYLSKCQAGETYNSNTRGSHEPGYVIPLLACNGQKKYFPVPLYRFNGSGDGHSQFQTMDHAQRFYDEYDRLCVIAIEALPLEIADMDRKCFLKKVSLLSKVIHLFRVARILEVEDLVLRSYSAQLLETINNVFRVNPPLNPKEVRGKEMGLINAVTACIFHRDEISDAETYPWLNHARLCSGE